MTSSNVVAFKADDTNKPTSENGTVTPPIREKSTKPRKYLTENEISQLVAQAKKTRHGHRLATMIEFAVQHGMRVSELVSMRWDDVDFQGASVYIRRVKDSKDSTHYLKGNELRALKRLKREADAKAVSPFMFLSERGAPISEAGFRKTLNRLGKVCGFTWTISPHALSHSCGYQMADRGADVLQIQAWMGHAAISSTMIYIELSKNRFDSIRSVW